MRYTVRGPDGSSVQIVLRDRRMVALLGCVFQALPENDWRAVCKALVLITDDEEKRTRRAWAATGPVGHGKFEIWLSPELGSRGPNFIKSAIAHELGHALCRAETGCGGDGYLEGELFADLLAAKWGYHSDGFGLTLKEHSNG